MAPRSRLGPEHADIMKDEASRNPEYRAALRGLRPYEQVARALIQLRQQTGLSQSALARLAGTSHSAVSRLESGQHPPNVETLRKIAEATGFELDVSFVRTGSATAARTVRAPHR
jgi:ribosome-binding protein aMBF1 (putative translation factor)